MKQYRCITYGADSKRGDGNQKVLAFRIESPDDVLEKENNPILSALKAENLSGSIGLYFFTACSRLQSKVPMRAY